MQVTATKIVVLGTGGTIAGTAAGPADYLSYTAGQVGIEQLLARIPVPAALALVSEQVAQVDSKDIDPPVWQHLLRRCRHWLQQPEVKGLVITHGTDTIEETAYLLQRVLVPAKPVVLTCAMRPASALAPDGPQNIADAVAVVTSESAQGVVVVCAGVIHGPGEVAKVHPYRLDPFSSGDAGPLGYVEQRGVRMVRAWPPPIAPVPGASFDTVVNASQWPRVEILFSHAGADGAIVQALLAQGVQGLVVAATGNGTVHQALESALLRAQAQGVKVLRSTRCMQGQVLPHAGDRLPAHAGSPVKARIDLLLELLG